MFILDSNTQGEGEKMKTIGKFKIVKAATKQDNAGNFADTYFVDDLSGKNHRNFNTIGQACNWAERANKFIREEEATGFNFNGSYFYNGI